jgi:hypothetical protein
MAQSIRKRDMRIFVSVNPKSNQKYLTLSQLVSITMKEGVPLCKQSVFTAGLILGLTLGFHISV